MTISNPSSFMEIALHGSQDLAINGLVDGSKTSMVTQAAEQVIAMQCKHGIPVPNALYATYLDMSRLGSRAPVKGFVIIGLIQKLMSKVCWVARGYNKKLQEAQGVADAIGKDYSQDAAEELGVSDQDRMDVKAVVDSDYYVLLQVQADCLSRVDRNKYDFQSLCYFTQEEPNPSGSGPWITTMQELDWDGALAAMETVCEKLAEESERRDNLEEQDALKKTYASQPKGVMQTSSAA